MKFTVQEYEKKDINKMKDIWNEVVKNGNAFPQIEELTEVSAGKFFSEQSFCGVAKDCESNKIIGLYILHPNNVGRCAHISNASFAVSSSARGCGVGELLVKHCMEQAKKLEFKILQFNAVVKSNTSALNLYKKLGFKQLGIIPNGFLISEGTYEDIIPHYISL